jgi:hypothetical protein
LIAWQKNKTYLFLDVFVPNYHVLHGLLAGSRNCGKSQSDKGGQRRSNLAEEATWCESTDIANVIANGLGHPGEYAQNNM